MSERSHDVSAARQRTDSAKRFQAEKENVCLVRLSKRARSESSTRVTGVIGAEGLRTIRIASNVVIEDLLGHVDVDPLKRQAREHEVEDEQSHVADGPPHAFLVCSPTRTRASATLSASASEEWTRT